MEFVTKLLFLIALLPSYTKAVNCPMPETIKNGDFTYNGVGENNTVTYKCRAGYVLSNDTVTRTCQNGTWDGTLPSCIDVDSYFTFVCDHNGVILAVNPDPTSLIWAQAFNEAGPCNTTFNAGNATVNITGCDIDKQIGLVFSPSADGIPTVILDNVKYYNITCITLPLDGINVMVTDNTWVKFLMSTSREVERTPSVILNSELIGTNGTLQVVTTAPNTSASVPSDSPELSINDKLRWRIEIPAPYIVRPLNCTAFSGEITAQGSKYAMDIIEMSCSLDISLVTDFKIEDPTKKNVAVADLWAFRFPNSEEVEIVCSVQGCPPGSTKCDFDCGSGRKKRSDLYNGHTDTIVDVQENSREKRHDEKDDVKSIRIRFRVKGPPTVGLEYLENGSPNQVSIWSYTTALTVCIVYIYRLFYC